MEITPDPRGRDLTTECHALTACSLCHIWHCPVCGCRSPLFTAPAVPEAT